MSKQKSKKKYSDGIVLFCSMIRECKSNFDWYTQELKKMDALTQDLLHSLELDDLSYSERAKVATKLKQCRQERRAYKDTIQVLQPLYEYSITDTGKVFLNNLNKILGETRKQESYLKNRFYINRVLDSLKEE